MNDTRHGSLWRLWLLLGVLWMLTLSVRPLFDPDEGRYAEIPREMLVSGDWVTPRHNGVKYFEKPPLQYWATATLYSVFGKSEWTSRLWSAALGFLCVPLVYGFARRIGIVTSADAAVMLVATGRRSSFDLLRHKLHWGYGPLVNG